MMRVVILAGGMGTRLQEETTRIPKPMVMIGDQPILGHIIRSFADQDFREFIIAGGYKFKMIMEWAKNNELLRGLRVGIINTGLETKTAGRLARIKDSLTEPFVLTYGDGLSDINYRLLFEHHERMRYLVSDAQKPLVTLTAVNPPSRFGRLRIEDGKATIFMEKGQDPEGWINAGFYVCESEVVDFIPGDECAWEKDILPTLALQGRLSAYQHTGQFQMMDTWRDRDYLNEVWETGEPFWRKWSSG